MTFRHFLPLSLLAVCCFQQVSAIETRVLRVGDNEPIALRDIYRVWLDATSMHISQTDGQTLDYPLQPILFEVITGLQQLPADARPAVPVCDVWGRPCQAGAEGLWVGRQGVCYGTPSPAASTAPAALTRSAAPMALRFHHAGIDQQMPLDKVVGIGFSMEYWIEFYLSNGNSHAFGLDTATGITFDPLQTNVTIQYDGGTVDGVNPFYLDGLRIGAQGAHVTAEYDNAVTEVEYVLSGHSDDGSLKVYSAYKWQATLQDLTLCNPYGPAINSQTGKKCTIKSPKGTVNTLADGEEYYVNPTLKEDQKGCVFGEGQLIFNGKGTVRVTSLAKHAICSDDYVSIDNGTVEVLAAASDAIHAKDSVIVQGGTVRLAPSSDGIDSDGPVTIRRGENGAPTLTITTTGDGAKGIKAGRDFLMTDGDVTITQTGRSEVKDGDTSRVVGIRATGNIRISGGRVVIDNRAEGGKPLSADGEIDTTGGNVQY